MSLDVGARLKALRARHGLSQRQLALRAGVTNASISLIESNKLNPSVGVLKRILDGVPLSLADFFADDGLAAPPAPRVFYAAADLVEIGRGGISYRQVGGDLTGHAIQLLSETYAPGADTGKVPLSHEGEEAGLVLSGRLEVTVGEQRRTLGPGDAYLFDSRAPHRFRNPGREPCVVISACTPPTF